MLFRSDPVIYGDAGCVKGDRVIADSGLVGVTSELFATGASPALADRYFPRGITDGFGLEILDFVTATTAGTGMEASGAEGVTDLAMAYAVLESSLAGVPVRVQDVLDGAVAGYQAEIDDHYHL